MNILILLGLLLIITTQADLFRLSTTETPTLKVGDSLISTLGLFKATLMNNKCQLSIQNWIAGNTNNYKKIGSYSGNFTGNCNSLIIREGVIVTQTNATYIRLGESYRISTIFNIDDWGVMRMIGTNDIQGSNDQVSEELNITDFVAQQNYIFPTTLLEVYFFSAFTSVQNLRNWTFSASNGELKITQKNNRNIVVNYVYSSVFINNSQIFDFNRNPFPGSIFPNITYQPRCFQPRLYLNFKPPFIFTADPYWPIFRVYEQGRYKILEVKYNRISQIEASQNLYRLNSRSQIHSCPPFTFEHQGKCIYNCPFPYYHQMRNQYGYCVLTCQEFTPKNQTTRICACYDKYQQPSLKSTNYYKCPQNSTEYPYGCFCNQNQEYFDRELTFSCVKTCPRGTLGIDGMCLRCPSNCIRCQIDKIFKSYLECMVCQNDFSVIQGQCYKICNPQKGFSLINGQCLKCNDPNCRNCSQNINICNTCQILYSLQGTNCIQTCQNKFVLAPYEHLSSVCVPIDSTCSASNASYYKEKPYLICTNCIDFLYKLADKCLSSCPNGFSPNRNNYCYCSNPSTLTIIDKCYTMNACPIKMGWNNQASSCVSCSFGCLTCFDGICTSCFPGFFFWITPQGMFCKKQSPLTTCDGQYVWRRQTCLPIQSQDPSLGLLGCIVNIPNCMLCSRNRQICVLCNQGFIVHNNTCIKTCPNNTVPYVNNVCILLEIENCLIPYLKINSKEFVFDFSTISPKQSPYQYYTFEGKSPVNDPVGYILYYQEVFQKIQVPSTLRLSNFYHPSWTCLKCNDGKGMTDDFSSCIDCPSPCKTCYLAKNTSCITLQTKENIIIDTTCRFYIDPLTNLCIQNCSNAGKSPTIINGTLYCSTSIIEQYVRIDSAIYSHRDGTNHVFFILDQEIKISKPINLSIVKESKTPVVSAGNQSTPNNKQYALLSSSGALNMYDSQRNNSLYILNIADQIGKVMTSNNVVLSNTIYGSNIEQSHPDFMKTWLAYIGYIMGITLILLHAVFIGNDLLYKMDNALILTQTIYYFSFVKLLVGKLLAQFYYGWIFAHFGFFPNIFQDHIASNYVENQAPNSYKLATMDANVIRNAGFSISLLLIFIGGYFFAIAFIRIALHLLQKPDIWHPTIAVNSFIAVIQFLSYNLMYWSIANLAYIGGADAVNKSFYTTSMTCSIILIVLICSYTIGRCFFNPIGGLYMFKRILLSILLPYSYENRYMLIPLIVIQTVFTIARYILETPIKRSQKMYLLLQYLFILGSYLLLFLSTDAGLNTIIISIIIFILIVVLAYDLTNVYLQSKNQWQIQDKREGSNGTQVMARPEYENQSVTYPYKASKYKP